MISGRLDELIASATRFVKKILNSSNIVISLITHKITTILPKQGRALRRASRWAGGREGLDKAYDDHSRGCGASCEG